MAGSSPRFTRCMSVWRRNAVGQGGFQCGEPSDGGGVDEEVADLFGEADLPWCAGGDLFSGDEPGGEPAVKGGGGETEFGGGVGDSEQFSFGLLVVGRWAGGMVSASGDGALGPGRR